MLEVIDITKSFHKGTIDEKTAIKNLSISLSEGEFVTVIGGNGAGKSTLLNCIAGSCFADSGKILLDGKNITKQPEYKRARVIGRVFQDPLKGTAFDMTIEENLSIACMKSGKLGLKKGIGREEAKEFREKLAELGLGLEDRMKHKVGLLSGGQRQALTLLMATIVKPSLLLLDEHTAALDPVAARKVLELTDRVVGEYGIPTLMVTHNMKEALRYGTRTIMLDNGGILIDVKCDERKSMTVDELVRRFEELSGDKIDSDRLRLV